MPDGKTLGDGTYSYDSTSNAGTTTIYNSAPAVTGKIDGAVGLNGSNQYLRANSSTPLSPNNVTITAWVKQTSFNSWARIAGKGVDYGTDGYQLYNQSNSGGVTLEINAGYELGATTMQTGVWYFVAGTYDGSTIQMYMNGNKDNAYGTGNTGNITSNTSPFIIGSHASLSAFIAGSIDEVQVSNIARSTSWILTEYNNQANPGTFYSVGSETSLPRRVYLNTTGSNKGTSVSGPTSGLVGYWTFNGADTNWNTNKVTDVSGQENTGTMISMSTTTSPVGGVVGQGLKFDGNGYVKINSDILGTGIITMSLWANVASVNTGANLIENAAGNGAVKTFFTIQTNYDRILFSSDGGNSYMSPMPAVNSTINKWVHYVVTRLSDGTTTMYRNGAIIGGPASSGTPATGAIQVYLGAGFNGSMDDVRIYNRALSASEITQLYNLGAAKLNINTTGSNKGRSSIAGATAGLVGYWSFNGPDTDWSKNLTYDMSNSYATGTMVSMSTTTSPVAGVIGQGLKFDGSTNYVIGSGTSFPTVWTTLTFSAWFKVTSLSSERTVFQSSSAANGWGVAIQSNGNPDWYTRTISDNNFTNLSVAVNTLYFIAVTRSGGTAIATLYNATTGISTSQTLTGLASPNNGNGSFLIGNFDGAGAIYYSGMVDDIRVYNRVLSTTEITQLYNLGKAKFNVKL
jgi:hypothetical protein